MEGLQEQDANLGPALLATCWTLAAIATLVIALRLLTRIKVNHSIRIDDYFMILSLGCGLINTVLVSVSVSWGLGRHLKYLSPARSVQAIKYDIIEQPFIVMTSCFGRISFALFLVQIIQKSVWRRRFLYVLVVLQFVINATTAIIIMVQCRPVQALWDPTVKGSCWSRQIQEYYSYFQGSFNALTDLTLAGFPATFLWSLNLKLQKKIGLILVMGLGIFAMVATIIKTIQLKALAETDDYTYPTALLIIWTSVEMYVVMIAASMPILVPMIRWVGEKISSYKNSVGSWAGFNAFAKKTKMFRNTRSTPSGRRSSKRVTDAQSEEYILPYYGATRQQGLEATPSSPTPQLTYSHERIL